MNLQIWWSPISIAKTYRFATPTLKQTIKACWNIYKIDVFRFLTPPSTQNIQKTLRITCALAIHEFCALFEVNRLRNTSVLGEK